jgi:hypothetical protein
MGPESCGDTRKRKSRRRSEISTKRGNQHTETYIPHDLIATVEVLSGVPPLDLQFSYLNRRFLISTFSKGSDTLRGRLQTLADLGSEKMMREFTSVRALGIEPRDSYVQHNFRALLSVGSCREYARCVGGFSHALHSVVSSSCFSSIISERFSGSTLIFTDGSRSEEGTGFGFYVPGEQRKQLVCLLRRLLR